MEYAAIATLPLSSDEDNIFECLLQAYAVKTEHTTKEVWTTSPRT